MASLAALPFHARVAAMRARALRPSKPLAPAEEIWRLARKEHALAYGGSHIRFSAYCRLLQRMALVRAWAALRMVRDGGGRVWRQIARNEIRDAAFWRRSAVSAAKAGR